MFAVPGWAVSATTLRSQAQSRPPQTPPPSKPNGNDESSRRSRKRKRSRGDGRTDVAVTDKNLGEMWEKHVERRQGGANGLQKAKVSTKSSKQEQKQRKKRRVENEALSACSEAKEGSSEATDHSVQSNGKAGKRHKERHPSGDVADGTIATTADSNAITASKEPRTVGFDRQKKPKTLKEKKREKKALAQAQSQPNGAPSISHPPTTSLPSEPPPPSKLTPLQTSMRQKLISARFRHLNQTLYTTPSSHALSLFTDNPELFAEYHAGFSRQVKESWPENPVEGYLRAIKERASVKPGKKPKGNKSGSGGGGIEALPRRPNGRCTIIDLGCGDARLARSLHSSRKQLDLKILSYDLHAPNELVTKADIANLPLKDGEVDVAIFCLSLMGTNWIAFVEEAWRVIRGDGRGEVWVSEVKSRFGRVGEGSSGRIKIGEKKQAKSKNPKRRLDDGDDEENLGEEIFAEDEEAGLGNDETDISAFVEVFRTRGFQLRLDSVDKSNKMFVRMVFVKQGVPSRGKWAAKGDPVGYPGKKRFLDSEDREGGPTLEEETKVLKPCVYKIR